MTKRIYDMLAAAVAQESIGTCFSLLGDANMNFATRLREAGCEMIYVRHEHCAVAAAMAYARKTGDLGLATVTCGPGLTQLMTALPAAVRAHLPMVILAGEAPLKAGWYNQAIDQAPFIIATGAAYHALHWSARMATALRDAFIQARREQRPVVLGIPFDLQDLPWDECDLPQPSRELIPAMSPTPPHPDDVASAAARVASAKRIVVMAGLGALHAGTACRALSERVDGLLATSLPARGLFHDDPYSIGISGGFSSEMARKCLGEADLIIAVGCSLAKHNTDAGKLWPNAEVLQIDTNPLVISQGQIAAQSHLRADAHLGVSALLQVLPERSAEWRSHDLARAIAETPADSASYPAEPGIHDPRDAVTALDAAIPQGWELVNSSGHCSYFFAQMPGRAQAQFLTIREFGAIGNGISFAMGVSRARPDTPVVLFDGDGSLLMHIQELETIQRHKMNILIIVFNDGAYGSEIYKLRSDGLSDAGAVFGRTDLAAVARGFGMGGSTITDLSAIPAMIAEFTQTGGAAVWDIPVSDQVASPVIRRAHPQR
ncbi:MAG: thiamine pyrophosphate-binding protein [Rhizobiales bacterium]|nr:thiamine pyrophosphate-binding protein [Hyphomicrobiales bacterium]